MIPVHRVVVKPAPAPKPIPTSYGGVDFRSRLEAKWAALFDIYAWRWTYESADLDGYLPDFYLHFDRGDVLFECKPEKRSDELAVHVSKIARSGWRRDFVIGGAAILSPRTAPVLASFGAMGEWQPGPGNDGEYLLGEAMAHRCRACDRVSFHHDAGSWRCAQCGREGKRLIDPIVWQHANEAWRQAGNRVQWKGRNVTP